MDFIDSKTEEFFVNPIITSCSSNSREHLQFEGENLNRYGNHNLRNVIKIENNNELYNKASRVLIDGTIENTINRNVFINIPRKDNNRYCNTKNNAQKPLKKEKLFDNTESNLLGTYTICSKYVPKVSTKLDTNGSFEEKCNTNIRNKTCAEKMTYCRPVLNLYNQEFIYKTIERNARLQGLVKKLLLAREKEKQEEAWNNYINYLKNKYRPCSTKTSISNQYEQKEADLDIIDDFYKTRFTFKQSNPCQNLLEDFYGAHNQASTYYKSYDNRPQSNYKRYYYDNEKYCYPTASEGSFMMLQRARQNQPAYRNFRGNTIVVDRLCKECRKATSTSRQNFERNKANNKLLFKRQIKNNIMTSISTQTVLPVVHEDTILKSDDVQERFSDDGKTAKECEIEVSSRDSERKEPIKEEESEMSKYIEKSNNVLILQQNPVGPQNDTHKDPLVNIENKLNKLIETINAFMIEIKSKSSKQDNKSASVLCKISDSASDEGPSTSYGLVKREQIICGMVQDNSNPLGFSDLNPNRMKKINDGVSGIDKILCEENYKSNKAKRDIENILNGETNHPCSVQITFDIPTRECSTEVTASLSKAEIKDKEVFVEEIKTPINRRDTKPMTIAVNTDPLSWLALFRISTETVKQLLSYMPNIDYSSYLSMLQFPHTGQNSVAHYVCNICGSAFRRPSHLSDHIQQHNLGKTRDCCVCRHVLDLHRTRPGLFACQYCGHRFTRAYCCELHQQACAKRLGKIHDVPSDLILLR